jgi:hypothetical protein
MPQSTQAGVRTCRYNHEVLYNVLMYRRPEKLFNLGGGVIYLNMPVGVPV